MAILSGRIALLRPAGPDDVDDLAAILAEPEVARWWGRWDRARVEADLLGAGEGTTWAIIVDGTVVGAIQASEEADPDYRHAGLDLFVATAFAGRGIGTDAVRRLAIHLVDERGHHRLTIDPAADNERAIRVYRRVGFRPVGRLRRYERAPDGTWRDGLLMDLLAEELVREPGDEAARRGPVELLARPARRVVAAVGDVIEDAQRDWQDRPGARVRRVRRRGRQPLPYLNALHPDVRAARPVAVGVRSIPVDEIAGTAVGGGDQRGGDFLPLRPFRGTNWHSRWQRLRAAHDRLEALPPVQVVKYAGRYWVVDGHNRVALALYSGQVEVDADITELVAPGARRTEPIVSMAGAAAGSRSLRTAAAGRRPSELLERGDEPVRPPEEPG